MNSVMLKPFRVPLALIFLICAAALSLRAGAAIRLPVLFSDSMVLQSERAARVWGWADDGELVVVQLKSQVLTTRATGGKWSVNLKPMKATRDPGVLAVMSDHGSIEFTNVVVGEVWIASGQSNMQWPLKK